MNFTVSLAGVSIAVNSIYNEVYDLCRGYLTDQPPQLSVSVSQSDIDFERGMSARESQPAIGAPYLETLVVYRKIATRLLACDTFLMHGAVIAVGQRAWLFTAPSGTGKTTHIRLWLENIPDSYVVNGDKPLIRMNDEITVFGTPWAGKEGMQRNTGVPLCGIVLLERGAQNRIEALDLSRALPTLVQQTYRPGSREPLEKTLELIGELGRRVPLYRLECNMLPEAALTAYETLRGSAPAL